MIERFRAEAARLYPNREAPYTAIEAISASARLDFDAGLGYETKLVNDAKATVEARALTHLFFAERATRRVPDLPADVRPRPIRSAAIVGSGTMGGGIAIAFANAGLPVTVLDVSGDALDRGLAVVDQTYESMVKRGRLTGADKAQRLELIRGTLDYATSPRDVIH